MADSVSARKPPKAQRVTRSRQNYIRFSTHFYSKNQESVNNVKHYRPFRCANRTHNTHGIRNHHARNLCRRVASPLRIWGVLVFSLAASGLGPKDAAAQNSPPNPTS